MDRHKIDFPAYVHDYFFDVRETVLTRQQVDYEKRQKRTHG